MSRERFRRLFATGRPRTLENLSDGLREQRQRDDDARFQYALAIAFQSGHHLPASASDSDSRMADAA